MLFRLFDILKPGQSVSSSRRLRGGFGVMVGRPGRGVFHPGLPDAVQTAGTCAGRLVWIHNCMSWRSKSARALKDKGWMLVTAESCTGGWVGEAVTMVPGSSEWFERGLHHLYRCGQAGDARRAGNHAGGCTARCPSRPCARWWRARLRTVMATSRWRCRVWPARPAVRATKPVGTVCLAWGLRGRDADRGHAVTLPGIAKRCGGSR